MTVFGSKTWDGSSLIEVMLSVALMAVTALGLAAGQLWTAREARAMAWREHGALIADALAEAMRAASAGEAGLRQWNSRAENLLPHGKASLSETGGVTVALVTWTAVNDRRVRGEIVDKPESCGGVAVPAGMSCVAVAFAK